VTHHNIISEHTFSRNDATLWRYFITTVSCSFSRSEPEICFWEYVTHTHTHITHIHTHTQTYTHRYATPKQQRSTIRSCFFCHYYIGISTWKEINSISNTHTHTHRKTSQSQKTHQTLLSIDTSYHTSYIIHHTSYIIHHTSIHHTAIVYHIKRGCIL